MTESWRGDLGEDHLCLGPLCDPFPHSTLYWGRIICPLSPATTSLAPSHFTLSGRRANSMMQTWHLGWLYNMRPVQSQRMLSSEGCCTWFNSLTLHLEILNKLRTRSLTFPFCMGTTNYVVCHTDSIGFPGIPGRRARRKLRGHYPVWSSKFTKKNLQSGHLGDWLEVTQEVRGRWQRGQPSLLLASAPSPVPQS